MGLNQPGCCAYPRALSPVSARGRERFGIPGAEREQALPRPVLWHLLSQPEARSLSRPQAEGECSMCSGHFLVESDFSESPGRAQRVNRFAVCLCLLHVLENSDPKGFGFQRGSGELAPAVATASPWRHSAQESFLPGFHHTAFPFASPFPDASMLKTWRNFWGVGSSTSHSVPLATQA